MTTELFVGGLLLWVHVALVHLLSTPRRDRLFLVAQGGPVPSSTQAVVARVRRGNLFLGIAASVLLWAVPPDPPWLVGILSIPIVVLMAGVAYGVSQARLPGPTGRYAVSLDHVSTARELVSWPLHAAHAGLFLGSMVLFVAMLPHLPEEVVVHWNAAWEPDGWASPHTWWFMPAMMLFDYGIIWLIAKAAAGETLALSVERPREHLRLVMERRRLSVRMGEWLMLGINLGTVLLWLGAASDGLPGWEGMARACLVPSLVVIGAGILVPIAVYIGPMLEVGSAIREVAGTEVLGTRAHGWKAGGMVYYAPDDPAVFVPKMMGVGYTFNFARPAAWILVLALLASPLALAALLIWAG